MTRSSSCRRRWIWVWPRSGSAASSDGGEITKAARNWLGNALAATKRSQIMFMDRDDILNLYVVTSLPLPEGALPPPPPNPWSASDEPPF